MSSFWDEYKEVGGNFVSGDEKKALMESGIPFDITQVSKRESGKFGPEYALSVLLPNVETGEPEERTMTFQYGTVGSRDAMLAELEQYLDGVVRADKPKWEAPADRKPIPCKLEKGGQATLIRKAE